MTQPGVQGGRAVCQVVFIAHEAAGQGVGTGVVSGRVGPGGHSRAEGLAKILGRSAVQSCAGDQAITVGGVPGQLAERAIVVKVRILVAWHVLVGVDAHRLTLAMFVGLGVEAADQLQVGPAPGGLDARAEGATVDVRGHGPRHHPGTGR
ncbi:hypothetical protein D3C80_1382830 [compost metagenome]